jgi:drug/metabolite transporter (DMT)-like permease
MTLEIIYIAIVAIFWGSYPLLARASGVSGAVGALILTLSALIPIGTAVVWQVGAPRPAAPDLIRLIVAGVMMGIGLVAFNALANSKQMDASISIPVVDTAMLIVSVAGAVMFFAEPVTAKKLIGIALMLAGIIVIRPT